jgi:photosystem II stability/assembly factor-like uncharacterized protein
MNNSPKKLLTIWTITLIALVISSCNMPGSGGDSNEPTATEDREEAVTEVDLDPTFTSEIPPIDEPGDGGDGPPTPDLSDVDPLGGYSPIDRLSPSDTPLTLTYLWMEDEANGWAIGDVDGTGDHVFRTDSGVESWEDVTPPAPEIIPDLGHTAAAAGAFLDDDTAWIIYYPDVSIFEAGGLANAFVWRTTNGGGTWAPSLPLRTEMIGSSNIPPDIVFTDANHGWIMMQIGGIGMHTSPVYLFRTTDGGATWEKLEDPYSGLYLQGCTKTGMAFYGSDYGMVTISDCPIDGFEVEFTSDGGVTWDALRPPPPASYPDLYSEGFCNAHSPSFLDDGTAIVGASCKIYGEGDPVTLNLLYRSTDFGASWSADEYPGGELMFLDEDTIWAFDGNRFEYTPTMDIYRTTDGGDNWILLDTVIWKGQFVFVDAERGWAIARNEDEIATVATDDGGASWSIVDSFVTE